MSATITVNEGDTLSKLALMYSVSPSRLRAINNLGIHDVHPGDVLKIESPRDYLLSRHHLVVMLISSSDFFRESHNPIHEDGSIKNDHKINEFLILKSAISGSVVLTDDLLIFNQMQTDNTINKERYTFFINLIAVSNTNLVPFYKHYSKSKNQKQTVQAKKEENNINDNQENEEQSQKKGSFSFFKRLFSSKNEQNDDYHLSKEKIFDTDDNDNSNENQTKMHLIQINHETNINFNGVETFAYQYVDEPAVLELCFFNDPLNKNLGIKSISFFASRAELNSLEFLINFFSRQRRIEIGLRIISSNNLPNSYHKNDSKNPNGNAFHSSLKKTSLINITHDEKDFINYSEMEDDDNSNSHPTNDIKMYIDGNGSFGYAIQTTVSYIPENYAMQKKLISNDKVRKIGSFTPNANLSSSPILSSQTVTKYTLNTLAPISCDSLRFSNAVMPNSSSSFFTDTFSYSQYPVSLTDSTSMILDCVNITMIRSHFPHRFVGLSWHLAFRLSRDGCSFHTLLDKTREIHPCVLAILTNKGESIGAFLSDGIHEGRSKSSGGGSFIFSFTKPDLKNKTKQKSSDDQSNDYNSNNNDNSDNDNNNNNNNSSDNNNSDNSDNNNTNTKNSSFKSTYFNRRNANVYKWSMVNDKFIIISTTDLMVGSTSVGNPKDKFKDRSRLISNYKRDIGGCGAAIWIDQKMNKGISENCPTFNSPPLVEGGSFTVNDIEIWNII